jgi:hypothetical protein
MTHDPNLNVAHGDPVVPLDQRNWGPGGPRAKSELIERWTPSTSIGWLLASLAVKLHDRLGHAGSQRYPAAAATFPAAIDRESTCQRGVSRGLAPHLMPGSGKSSV